MPALCNEEPCDILREKFVFVECRTRFTVLATQECNLIFVQILHIILHFTSYNYSNITWYIHNHNYMVHVCSIILTCYRSIISLFTVLYPVCINSLS